MQKKKHTLILVQKAGDNEHEGLRRQFPLWTYGPHSQFSSVQFSSFAQSYPTLRNPVNCSTPGLPVHHQLPESTQTNVH